MAVQPLPTATAAVESAAVKATATEPGTSAMEAAEARTCRALEGRSAAHFSVSGVAATIQAAADVSASEVDRGVEAPSERVPEQPITRQPGVPERSARPVPARRETSHAGVLGSKLLVRFAQ